MKNMKKTIAASAVSIVLCAALLVGATFAWFTDSIVNKGNKIQAGNLKIEATAYDLGTGGTTVEIAGGGVDNSSKTFTFEQNGEDLRTSTAPIINDSGWEPGKTNAKLLTVKNKGSLAAKIKLEFSITENGLTEALWYDFIQVSDGQATGRFTRREMSTLNGFADEIILKLGPNGDAEMPDTLTFIMVYGMDETAGNEYRYKKFSADLAIIATQAAYEVDGFGNSDYDATAPLEYTLVSNSTGLQNAISAGENVMLATDVTVGSSAITVDQDVVLDLNGNTVSTTFSNGIIDVNNADVTIRNGTIKSNRSASSSSALYAYGDSNVTVENCTVQTTKSGTFAVVTNGADSLNSNIVIRNSVISGLGTSGKGFAGYFAAGNVTLENCDVTGHICISGGNVTIDGGTYTATGFMNQEKIYNAADTASYEFRQGYATNFGDSILIIDRQTGYDLSSVVIRNVEFNTEITLKNETKGIAYAIKYIDLGLEGDARTNLVVENNTYNHKIDNADPVMFIDKEGTAITNF